MLSATRSASNDPIFCEGVAQNAWPLTRSTELSLVIGAVVVQIAILVGMIVLDGLPLVLGERIKLPVVPVDPHDFFRGDYVVLSYDFSRFDPTAIEGMPSSIRNNVYDPAWQGREVFIPLEAAGDHYQAGRISTQKPASGRYLRGRVSNNWRTNIECGIEAFYVQEGEGKRLENLIRERKILAEVAVLNGQAKLVRLVE